MPVAHGFVHEGKYYPIESEMGKELAKWERDSLNCPIRPGRPWRASDPENEYPKMLYMARRTRTGIPALADPNDDSFAQGCQKIVHNADQERFAKGEGWTDKHELAVELLLKREDAIAETTARRHYQDAKLSEAAQKEAAEVDASTPHQVPEIPEVPKKRGRPRKVQPEAN